MKKLILAALLVCPAFAQKVDWSQIKNVNLSGVPIDWSQITNKPTPIELDSSFYDFTPQAPGTSLSAGNTQITLRPVPPGVNWND